MISNGGSMKKILYITTLSRTINAFLIPHIKMLIDEGYIVDCACCVDQDIDNELLKKGVKVYNIPFKRNPFYHKNMGAFRKIKKIQEENKYDIIHVHTPVAGFISRVALRKEKSISVIYTTHGLHFYNGAPLINWLVYYPLERIAAHWTDSIVAINSEDLSVVKKFSLRNGGQTHLIHGVGISNDGYELLDFDKREYKVSLGLNSEDFIVLILAEINKNKNHIQIIKAIDILKERYPNIKVLCAGEGPLINKMRNEAYKLKLDKNILFIGYRKDVKQLLNICDCVALFSKREGLGKCLLEGMVIGKPLIATSTRGAKELIENGKNGYLVKLNDYNDTALKLEKLFLDSELRLDFGRYSKDKLNNYLLQNVLEEIKDLY